MPAIGVPDASVAVMETCTGETDVHVLGVAADQLPVDVVERMPDPVPGVSAPVQHHLATDVPEPPVEHLDGDLG